MITLIDYRGILKGPQMDSGCYTKLLEEGLEFSHQWFYLASRGSDSKWMASECFIPIAYCKVQLWPACFKEILTQGQDNVV